MAFLRVVVVALCAWGAGCGDALVEADYRGAPLFAFSGQIVSFEDLRAVPDAEIRVGLFWSPSGETAAPVQTLIEQPSASVSVSFPATFRLSIFQPPEARMLWQGRVGVGVVLVYQDLNGDGRFNAAASPTELLGGAQDVGVLYASEAVGAALSPTFQPLDAGFAMVRVPALCEDVDTVMFERDGYGPPAGSADCGVPVGAACARDADCGARGVCLTRVDGLAFPRGYCSVPTSEASCAPAAGWAVNVFEDDEPPAHWFLKCDEGDTCRLDDGYICDPFVGVCLADLPIDLSLLESFAMDPLCLEVEDDGFGPMP